ncbi:DUF1128 domain-containing protein [Bacillus spongiae]|uniref:UPF0435 protein WAK64_16195 n=1 Tax=Bacillus spongiae TaxID=2683610 RepID=A0ABU8HGS8_9BACI
MELKTKSTENMVYMLDEIKAKLRMVNESAVNSSAFNIDKYDDIKDIYEFVMKKPTFSPNEMQAIVEELGSLRK